jgi:uncharacterized repeat protein (TIGR03803 family)
MRLASFRRPHAPRPCAHTGSYFSPEVIEMERKQFLSSNTWLLAIFVCVRVFVGSAVAAGSAESVLYRFKGGSDGYAPFAGLIADKVGNLYATTADGGAGCHGGCGTVFELSPASGGRWTETVLYRFTGGGDGAVPESGLIFDAAGNLYGTTIHGGASGDGTIFQLMAPTGPGRAWTLNVLHSFIGHTDGKLSMGNLIFDQAGNLYGPTLFGGRFGGGTIFQLAAPAAPGGAWTLNVLHSFKGGNDSLDPVGALIFDKKGALYGTTYAGTVFKEVPPAPGHTAWTLRVLYGFNDVLGLSAGGLIAGKKGVLYGATALGGSANAGTVFQLTPPVQHGGAWTATTLYGFAGGSDGAYPLNGLIADKAGNLYGVTENGGASALGTVFKLTPTQHGAWTKTTLHDFSGGSDGSGPGAGLIFGRQGILYGTTVHGGSSDNGTVFEVAP